MRHMRCATSRTGTPARTGTGRSRVSVTLEHSPAGRSKAGIAVSFDADPRLASLIIWDTGETELDLADLHRRAHHATPRHQLAHRGRPDRHLDQPRRAIAAQLHNDPGLL